MISGATLSTPPLEFDTEVLGGIPVRVKATFTQVTPGGGTGLVTATPPAAPEGQGQRGQVVLRDSVKVSLNLRIGNPLIIEATCESTPVNLELFSDGPYTQAAGGKIVDANFTMPEMPTTPQCISNVSGPANDLLAGSGHSLSMVIEGDLPVPELKPETRTTLTADPAGGSIRGNTVTLTATVAEVEPNDLDPTGTVVFREGTRTLGTAELAPNGTATLTTTELRAGDRALTAAYQGDAEFAPSTSAPLTYSVAPAPVVTADFPEFVARGAAPVEFDLTIDNTDSPRAVANGRVDIVLPNVLPAEIVLERQLPDSSWEPISTVYGIPPGGGLASALGTLGPANGTLVPAGGVQTHRLRVSMPVTAQNLRAASFDLSLVLVDPGTGVDGARVASTSLPFDIISATRMATVTTAFVHDTAGIRPGHTLIIEAYVNAAVGGAPVNTGQVEFLIDGKVMGVRRDPPPNGPLGPTEPRITVLGGIAAGKVEVPADLASGPHVVTARYVGDASHRPSTSDQVPLSIVDPLGPLYTCDLVTTFADRYGAYIEASVRLPASAVDGEEIDLDDLEVVVVPGGIVTTGVLGIISTMGEFGVQQITIDLGDAGTITGDGVAYEMNFGFDENFQPIPSDQRIELQGLEGTIVADGQPGDLMPLPVERIEMAGKENFLGSNFTITCTPRAEPTALGGLTIAGVSLTAESATDPLRAGDEVVLTATVAPAGPFGLVEFFSGSTSLGTASAVSGAASITVDDLPVGPNALSARYTGVRGSPFRSDVVQLAVLPAVECAAFAESGHAATVRLVYLELLGRCPDQAGFDFWTGRLAGGTSPEVFARSIARTPEAVGQVVDDAYWTMLGRAPDAAGRAFWVNRMRTGSGRYDQLLADLGASAEFWNLSGATRAGFVTRVYEQLLNRAPDEPGLDYWVARLTPGASRRTLILSLANLDEPLGRLVGLSYDEILGRTPSGTERTDGITVLRRTGDRSGFYAQLIGQPEFSTRAQGFPNPED